MGPVTNSHRDKHNVHDMEPNVSGQYEKKMDGAKGRPLPDLTGLN